MTIQLTPKLQKLVEAQVKAGRFASPSEAVNLAVDYMFMIDHEKKRTNLLAALDEGIADIENGRIVEFTAKEIIAECRKEFDAGKSK